MPKRTLQQRLVDALVATGRGTIVQSRSRKYITLKRPDGTFFYVAQPERCASARPSPTASPRPTISSNGYSKRRRNCAEWDGTRVRNDNAENFVEDLVSCGFEPA